MKFFWLVVWNIFPYLGNTHPNWRTLHIFQRGGSTTNQMRFFPYDPLQIHHPWRLFSSQGASCWQCRRRARSRDFTQWWIEAAFEWWLMVDLGYKILGVKNPMKFEDAQTNNKWESNSPNDSPNETYRVYITRHGTICSQRRWKICGIRWCSGASRCTTLPVRTVRVFGCGNQWLASNNM